ncbi:methyltransferase domain-containing protein [Nocardia vaccinii]|uniref:methyltransferase domain-containing protein n=1 Tax=Nocardia vaccinii TaxID=1822 RepID=UPI001471AC34|nr:methyltransferase domain-containing protein [Nocardia vaccinii]
MTKVFGNMLSRSIPEYDVMRQTVLSCGLEFVAPNSAIVDCGASDGGAIAPFVDRFADECRYLCIESSEPMANALRHRFSKHSSVEIYRKDLRCFYPEVAADLTLSVLTLQFIPIEHRQRVVRNIFEHTRPGGALVLVEKVLGADAEIDEMMVRLYHRHKYENGYSREQIDRKALSLEGVLVPVTADWNIELLRQAGFDRIDCFWRWMNFAGWIAIRSR